MTARHDQSTTLPEGLARRLPGDASWGDLVVSAAVGRQLQDLADRISYSACASASDWALPDRRVPSGASALFTGDPGTGKTLAARVLAAQVGRDLWAVDLGRAVNKYVGETEKNLRHIFDAAGEGNAVLFFDEADALFGQRTGVKDSHDRHSNLEVGYLLQRIEAHCGLVILATNGRREIDPAFLRRLTAIVHFSRPDADSRRELWLRSLPGDTSVPREVDLDLLTPLELTGGEIRAIASRAVLEAVAAGGKVTTDRILAAAASERLAADAPAQAPRRARPGPGC